MRFNRSSAAAVRFIVIRPEFVAPPPYATRCVALSVEIARFASACAYTDVKDARHPAAQSRSADRRNITPNSLLEESGEAGRQVRERRRMTEG